MVQLWCSPDGKKGQVHLREPKVGDMVSTQRLIEIMPKTHENIELFMLNLAKKQVCNIHLLKKHPWSRLQPSRPPAKRMLMMADRLRAFTTSGVSLVS